MGKKAVSELTNCIFQESWWLEAVAPGQWARIDIQKGGRTTASFSYAFKKRFGKLEISQPPFTQTLGPVFEEMDCKIAKRLGREKEYLTEIIERLPPFSSFRVNFHHSIQNWLPFYWRGFQQTTRYSYVLEDITDLENIWSEVLDNIRTDVRKAEKSLTLFSDLNIDDFLILYRQTFERQGAAVSDGSEQIIRRLHEACIQRQRGRIFYAKDSEGRIHGAVFIVWDKRSAYYLMGASDPALRKSGVNSFLLWEAIKFSSTVAKRFDFEGSMIEPIEKYFRAFGARQVPYISVYKLDIFQMLRMILRTLIGR